MRCGDVKQIRTAREQPRRVKPRQLTGFGEHPIEIERHRHQALILHVVSQLCLDGVAFIPRHQVAANEPLERVRKLELVQRRVGNLTCGSDDRSSNGRKALGAYKQKQGRSGSRKSSPAGSILADDLRTARHDDSVSKHRAGASFEIGPG
jgi:hypothetical protein